MLTRTSVVLFQINAKAELHIFAWAWLLRRVRSIPIGRHRLDRGLGGAGLQHARGGGGGSCANSNRGAHRIGRSCRSVPYRLRCSPGCRPLHIALMGRDRAVQAGSLVRVRPGEPIFKDLANRGYARATAASSRARSCVRFLLRKRQSRDSGSRSLVRIPPRHRLGTSRGLLLLPCVGRQFSFSLA